MSIPFTQYLLPHGRTRPTSFSAPPDIEQQAHELIAAGFVFEIEVLTTGLVSMTCEDPEQEDLIAIEVCENGPPIVQAVKDLVEAAHNLVFLPEATDD